MQTVRLKKQELAQAFQALSLSCIEQIASCLDGVQAGDEESLHQMRVGLRRLRALLSMFEPLLATPPDIGKGLNWLSGKLGPVRDWDVLASTTLKRVRGLDTSALQQAARAKSAAAHEVVLQALRSSRFRKLMLRLRSWTQAKEWHKHVRSAGKAALSDQAARSAVPLLKKAQRRLRSRVAALEPQDAAAVHRVRIAAKKARYGAEFFRDILHRSKVAHYIAHLSALQDQLGLLNDLAVATRLLTVLAQESRHLVTEAGYALGYVAAEKQACLAQLGKPLKAASQLRMI